MAVTILIDTGFLYALLNQRDKNHQKARDFMLASQDSFVTSPVVLPELCFLVVRDFGHRIVPDFLKAFLQSGLPFEQLDTIDIQRAQEIMTQYAGAKPDIVDCVLMAQSERLNITRVCTFDRRDFSLFRPKHCDFLELPP